ncbi:MAG: hypothetical protein H6745_24845 [Deltaproteobacteria bacterium]|nr:hypothetical protein [Deltaproteobacteria bacterium]
MVNGRRSLTVGVVVVAALVGAVSIFLWLTTPGGSEDGPSPIAWDRIACSHCRMHVGEPAFAAQLRDEYGDLEVFDDPGCLFTWRDQHVGPVRAVFFHASEGDSWIPESEVGFLPHEPTPMGYGYAAVPKGTAGALTIHATREALVARGLLPAPTAPVGTP